MFAAALLLPGSTGHHRWLHGAALCTALLLSACSLPDSFVRSEPVQPKATATEGGQDSPQAAVLPSEVPTLAPSETAAPRHIPTAPPGGGGELSAEGPWLLFAELGLFASSADGSGRRELFQLDQDSIFPILFWSYETTPDGWIAAESAGLGRLGGLSSVMVTHLPETQAVYEVPLVNEELAEQLSDPELHGDFGANLPDVYFAVSGDLWLDTMAWSPDGRRLAFAAALDGDSADIYVLDAQTGELTRASDGPDQARLLGWSPDSRWVIHQEFTDVTTGDENFGYTVLGTWAAAADGSGARRLEGVDGPVMIAGWSSDSLFTVVHHDPYFSFGSLDLVQLDSGLVNTIHSGPVYEWTAHPEPGPLAFTAPDPTGEAEHLFLFSIAGGGPQVDDIDQWLEDSSGGVVYDWEWSPELEALLVQTSPDSLIALTTQRDPLLSIEGECGLPLASPDRRWLAFGSCPDGTDGLRLHNLTDGSIQSLSEQTAYALAWLPDSSRLYWQEYLGDDQFQPMWIDVPDGAPQLLAEEPSAHSVELRVIGAED